METSSKNPGRVREGVRLALIGVLGLVVGLIGSRFVPAPWDAAGEAVAEAAAEAPAPIPSPPEPPPPQREVRRDTVRKGDTASALFRDLLSPQQIHDLAAPEQGGVPADAAFAPANPTSCARWTGTLRRASCTRSTGRSASRSGGTGEFHVDPGPIDYTVRVHQVVQGEHPIEPVRDRGGDRRESPELAIRLSDIFAWDIDFILDIREGDSFQALVETPLPRRRAGGLRTHPRRGVREPGRGVRRRPVPGRRPRAVLLRPEREQPAQGLPASAAGVFERISSGYSKRRFHPITKTWKSHPAIDYAAPTGTPIKTVGDGTVVERGYTSGNGNYVKSGTTAPTRRCTCT